MRCKVIATYIRLSVEDGDLTGGSKVESNSVVNQRMLLSEFIQSREDLTGCRVVEFCDDGYTGTNFERPGFQEMMVQVKLKQIDCIVVKDLSRFGREYLDVSSYLELILPVFDIRFISVNDGFDSNDYVGTTGGMELAFRNLIKSHAPLRRHLHLNQSYYFLITGIIPVNQSMISADHMFLFHVRNLISHSHFAFS